ncbi:hypothetical protein SDC9_39296 [bioreactor metagenome]|uniref:Secretion system C-terminal sorting domain-containing protein n=1 Tax=bioreactor metagenome TaxID=1076179 RepID=A0A644VPN7_9ZZZZ
MKIKFYLFAFAALLINVSVYAQFTVFEKTYGGANSDIGYDLTLTQDGGYAFVGLTYSTGSGMDDCYLIKTDDQGNLQWQKTYGGTSYEFGLSVIQDSNGNYVIIGTTSSYGEGSNDYYVIKTNSIGDTIWTKTYGGFLLDSPRRGIATNDSGYAIIGRTQSFGEGTSSVYFVKIDSAENNQFSKTYGGTGLNWGMSVKQTSDGGYILAGKTSSFSAQSQDVYLIKTNSSGDTLWTKYFGSANDDWANDVVQTPDNGYIITGTYNYSGIAGDIFITKCDENGNILWTKTYSTVGDEFMNSLINSNDGGILMTGATNYLSMGDYDLYLMKADASGDTLWTRAYGGSGVDAGFGIQQTTDGGIISIGQTNSMGAGNNDFYVIKTNNTGTLDNVDELYENSEVAAFPNPFSDRVKFIVGDENYSGDYSLVLYDATGKVILSKTGKKEELIIEKSGMPDGIYFYLIKNEHGIVGTGKLITE